MNADERTHDEAAIQQLLTQHARAIRDRDAGLAVSVFSPDAICYDLDPPLRHGPDKVLDKARIQAWFDTWRGPIESERRELRIEIDGEIAFTHALQHMTGTKRDGKQADLWFRRTTCLRKQRGSWKIVHDHSSVPFYMDGSDRAAIDLDA